MSGERSVGAPPAHAIAVVGMAGRFPGAADLDGFWRNLCAGVESVRFFTDEELAAAGVDPALVADPAYVKAGAVLDGIERFDAGFFGYSPREAELIDPQQRLLLECAWQALEDAGADPERFAGPIGVYAGATLSSYLFHLAAHRRRLGPTAEGEAFMGNAPDFLATRVAYKLDLKGPAYSLHTACSTSLVAVHLACQGLLNYEVDLALAGGVSVRVPHVAGYLYQESGITSPDGHTRPFDAGARGTLFGNGVGVVALKRLEDALAQGDRVLAAILGSATNNDGALKVGFTAPSPAAQTEVIVQALAAAGVDPDTLSYVEAHGTGTALGDPVEVEALTRAFRRATERRGFCALGSVKSNIGHLDAAAGVSGLIKTVLALRHGLLPPSLHFERPNPKIDFAATPFVVNTALRDWPRADGVPRRAGLSSFGFGGTNVHVVLEEAPAVGPSGPARPWQLLPLSARTPAALAAAGERLADRLEADSELPLADAAFTLQVGRRAFEHRRVVVAGDRGSAVAALRGSAAGSGAWSAAAACDREGRPVAFLFPGQGAQHPGMGRDLYDGEPTFRRELDRAAELLLPRLGLDLREALYPAAGADEEEAAARLRDTALAQPALFAVERALAALWMEWGVRPAAMLGHSLGEWVAAQLAGVFTLEDAVALVAERGRLMAAQPAGAMLAVALPEGELAARLGDGLEIAAVNGPAAAVAAGPEPAVEALAAALAADGVEHRRLHTSHAFHTAAMEPAAADFERRVAEVPLEPPEVPFVSNRTGTWITAEEATDPAYWAEQLRRTVRFGDGLATLLAESGLALVEVGPGETLSGLARRHPAAGEDRVVVGSLAHPRRPLPGPRVMRASLGRLWLAGAAIDWAGLHAGERRLRVALPTYPFERRRYWIGDGAAPAAAKTEADEAVAAAATPALHDRPELATAYAPPAGEVEEGVAAVFGETLGVGRVGRDDDFFALGGDSLMATRVLSRLRDRFGVRLPLDRLFAAPTAAGLALAVEEAGGPAPATAEAAPAAPPLLPVDREGELPLSFAQQRLWFLDQLDPGAPVYNLPGGLRLAGALDAGALRRALAEVVRRHEALRTRFPAEHGRPVQVVDPEAAVDLPVVDLEPLPAGERERVARRLLTAEVRRPFDLARGPLVRARLLRLAADEHLVVLVLHHIAGDGWSWGVLRRELASLYAAFAAGRPSPLAPLELQYADFAAWQRAWLAGETLESELAFWRRQLTPPPPRLALPTDRLPPAVRDFRGGTVRRLLPAALIADLEARGRERGATPFMVLLAGFAALLARCGGQTEFALGTPVANRRRTEVEGLIGFFVNTLVLRLDLSGDPGLGDLLARVKEVSLAAFAHQDLPFERVAAELLPERDRRGETPVEAVFVLQNAPSGAVSLPGLTMEVERVETALAQFDLTLEVVPQEDGAFEAAFHYASALFDRATVERLAGHYRTLLAAAAAEPERPLSTLALLTPAERRQLLDDWSGAGEEVAAGERLEVRFAARAEATPDAVAVSCGDLHLSYGGLRTRAARLADTLRSLGVGPEVRVGLCLDRTPAMAVAILGILEAGGAYLPLDPAHPAERLAWVLADAGARVVLTEAALAGGLPADGPLQVLLEPAGGWRPTAPRAEGAVAPSPSAPATAGSAAYVIYTSGSTGRPKGVVVPHAQVGRLFAATERWFGFGPGDVWTLFHSIAFDFSVWELWGALLYGGRVVIVPAETRLAPDRFHRLLVEEGVTVLNQTPSAFRQLIRADEGSSDSPRLALREVIFGGEALEFGSLRTWFERHGDARPRLVNMYGITETTVHVTYRPLAARDAATSKGSLIGVPIPDLRLFVLDRHLEPVPPGVRGELFVGGAGLARGYLGRPALTAQRFVPDPFAKRPGSRLYRSGDLARFQSDGELEYLGRMDHQVQLRGFRVELGEIEAALTEHPGVREAVVLAREDSPGELRLVAYLVARGEAPADAELRGWLGGRLPDYMVPAGFVALDDLPLTANGKVDRRALLGAEHAPDWGAQGGGPYAAPSTPAEAALAAVWAEVLHLERVGIHDNFFALGGDSILSIQIVARARAAGLELNPRAVFLHPTVAELAAVAGVRETARDELDEAGAPAGEVPLTPIQRWFFAAAPADPHHWNQAVMLAPREPLAAAPLAAALGSVVGHHDALRLRFEREGEGWRQRYSPSAGPPPLAVVDLGALPREWRRPALTAAAALLQTGFDLARGPLVAAALFRAGGGREGDRLLVAAHHLVIDGVSWRILLADLAGAYRRLARGEGPRLPRRTSSYRAYAERLVALAARGDGAADEVEGWLAATAGAEPLPLAPAAGGDLEGTAATAETSFTEEETEVLLRTVPATLRLRAEEVLLAALAEALAGWTGRRSHLVALEGHGRDEETLGGLDLSRTVGWFTALYPVRLEAPADADLPTRLAAIKQGLRSVPRGGLGYGLLRYLAASGARGASDAGERLAGRPAPEVLFNYLGQLDRGAADGAGLFALADEPVGPLKSPRARRRHPLEIDAGVSSGRLRATWTYGRRRLSAATVEALAAAFAAAVRAVVDHARSPAVRPCLAAADFPLAGLAADAVGRLAAAAPEIEDVYPLTPVQEGMLFHTLYRPGSGVYLEQLSCALLGDLDADAFDAAWQDAVERHPALRTSFVWEGFDRPLQVVAGRAPITPEHRDWRDVDPAEVEERWRATLAADRGRPFDLPSPPLLRVLLVRTADRAHRFLWSFHHLILDGWSASVVLKEVFDGYRARTSGVREAPARSAPARPFRDYVAWLGRDEPAAADAYWHEVVGDLTAPTPLGIDRGEPPAAQSAGERGERTLLLPAAATAALEAFGRAHGLTLNTLVEGAWALLLGRYAGVDDVVFGTTVSGRPAELAGVEEMVGLFINTLPVRVALPPEAELLAWLASLQDRFLDLRRFEHTPLARVQGLSGLPAGEPLFASLVVFENYPLDESLRRQQGALRVEGARFVERADSPLVLVAVPGDRLLLRAGYDRDRLDDGAAERLLGHLANLLDGFVAHPEQRLGERSELGPEELRRLLVDWNEPRADYDAGGCLHQIVEEQARRTPDAAAVIAGEHHLSYGELDSRADRLADRLRAFGVGPEALVGIAVDRSPELPVGLLGILKAGGAYLPLDPEYPAERLALILRTAGGGDRAGGVRALVTAERHLAALPADALAGTAVVSLDGCEQLGAGGASRRVDPIGAGGASRRPPAIEIDHLAYVMFTSGSTGVPKGVMIPHRGVVNRLRFAPAAGQLRPGDRFLQKASISFDVSLLEIFLPLLAGGAVVLARPGGHQDPAYLARLMADEEVTQAIFTPSLLRLLLEEEEIVRCRALHSVASSAEALAVDLQRRFHERLPAADLYNRYGPTEASIAASSWLTDRERWERRVPIGRPIARARLYVVDRRGRPVAAGVPGELVIGGPGLARGYLGQPRQTAERFVPDPFAAAGDAGEPGARLYRTGDLARFRADGAVEFLGRIDHQVKVRGFRVELGEIEATLLGREGVREAAVIDREERPGEVRLHAYVAAEEGRAPSTAELRAALAETLPAYMVPASVTLLAALPRTPNGKLDRRALPAPEASREQAGIDYRPPRSPVEAALAAIFAEVLGVDRVGVDDDFFHLGGDSILSLRVVSRAGQAGIRLALRDLFAARTVAALAALAPGDGERTAVDAEQGPVVGEAPLAPVQRRFFAQDLPDPDHFNQAVMLAVDGAPTTADLAAALGRLLAHHDALRLRFTRAGEGEWRQRFAAPGEPPAVSRLDLSRLDAGDRRRAMAVAAAAAQAGLDLADGPLLRAVLFHLGGGEADRLLLAVHHLAVDGVSWRVLLEDLETLLGGPPTARAALPAKTTSYRRWTERLVELATSPELAAEAPFWLEQTRPAAERLPVDHPEGLGGDAFASARSLTAALDPEETEALLRELPEVFGTGVDEALLTALLEAFAGWTGRRGLLVDLEGHGREHSFDDVDVSRTVGWFTAVYPLRLELPEGTGAAADAALRAVKERLRRVPRGGLGYGLLRYLRGDGDEIAARLAALPAAEVSFNYLGRIDLAVASSSRLRPAAEPVGPTRGGLGRRRYAIEVDAAVADDRLSLRWTWGGGVTRRETVERVAEATLAGLRALIAAARRPGAGGYTPSDFPTVDLDQGTLDEILKQVGALAPEGSR